MRIIGLTGGTGSGKSTVAKILSQMNIKIIDADVIARKVVQKGQKALNDIVKHFGKDILLKDGQLNRKKLASIVFTNKEKLKLLNSIIHKYIINDIQKAICDETLKDTYDIIIIDAPVLIESGLDKICDEVWVVITAKQERINRLMNRDLITLEEAKQRIDSQMSDEQMLNYASEVIYNDSDYKSLQFKVKELIENLKNR